MTGSPGPLVALTLVAVMTAGCSTTPFGAPVTGPLSLPVQGYLGEGRLAALAAGVAAPSAQGSPEQALDRSASERYRILEGGDRWLLANAHGELRPRFARQHFDCALGVRFQASQTPRLTAMLEKVLHDANAVAERVKAQAYRPRPVAVDPGRPACRRTTGPNRASASYPSGGAAVGTAFGEVMATLDPDHAAPAREIGRQIGISRAVCGMHYDSDVAAGADLGLAVARDILADPAFAADLAMARVELAQVRATGLTNAGCTAEAATLSRPLPDQAGSASGRQSWPGAGTRP